ncbi:hypothetical protein SCALM49S_03158 [Streptomyces californicus]
MNEIDRRHPTTRYRPTGPAAVFRAARPGRRAPRGRVARPACLPGPSKPGDRIGAGETA